MSNIRLKSLELINWKGATKLKVEFNNHNTVVLGTNETKKTTIADAYRWLLFDKNSQGDSQFGIKPLDKDNNEKHHLNSIVTGIFIIDDKEVELTKDYHEVWTKKRGTTQQKFSGHTTDHYIDEEPVKKSDYEDYINGIISEDIFKLITDPLYFNSQLHWEKQKEIIFSLVNEPDPGDIAAQAQVYYLVDNMGDKNPQQYQKILKSKMTRLNKKLEEIPNRIDEVQRGLSVEGLDYNSNLEELDDKLEKKKQKYRELQKEITEIQNNQDNFKKEQLIRLKEKYSKHKEALTQRADKLLNKLRVEKNKKQVKINEIKKEIDMLEDKIPRKKEALQEQKDKKDELLQEQKDWEDKKFTVKQKTCPECGQELPEDMIDEHRQDFNNKKANKLEDIKSKKEDVEGNINRLESVIENWEDDIKNKQEKLEPLQKEADKLEERINKGVEYKNKIVDGELEELEDINTEIKVIKKEIETQSEKPPEKLETLKENLKEVDKEITEINKKIGKLESIEKAKKRIEELQEEAQRLSDKYEQLEKELYDTEKYIKQKIAMMEGDVNDLFSITRFKLFEEQVNGAIKTTCEALKDGIPYSDMNTGSKYQVGMDIINVLANHYEVQAPVFIDNRERIANLPEIDSQTIHLIMSPKYKKLEIVDLEDEGKNADKLVKKEGGMTKDTLF